MIITKKWSDRYLIICRDVAAWSKDPSTKVGAVVVGDKGQILSQGYNGFPRGINDTAERYNNKKRKYELVVHAEMNAIYNASYSGQSLDGATMFVSGLHVCHECAKAIIQTGITKVVAECGEVKPHWEESLALTKAMFIEAGVEYMTKEVNDVK